METVIQVWTKLLLSHKKFPPLPGSEPQMAVVLVYEADDISCKTISFRDFNGLQRIP